MIVKESSNEKLEVLQLSYSGGRCEEISSFSNIFGPEISAFQRFKALNHSEVVTLLAEEVYVSRHDGDEALPYLKIHNIPSYLIIEKVSEVQVKEVRNVTDWANVQAISTPKKSVASGTHNSDLDITGSPLQCPFQNFEQMESSLSFQECELFTKQKLSIFKTYYGFSIEKARSLALHLRLILKALQSDGLFLPPIWIACNGNDALKTMFLGIHVCENGSATCSLTVSDSITGAENLPPIDHINSHFSLSSLQALKTRGEAVYEVISRKEGKSSSLDLWCHWTRPLVALSPPGLDATTIVKLHLELNDEKSRARFLFLELNLLRNLIDGFRDNCLTWYQKRRDKTVKEALTQYFIDFTSKVEKRPGTRDALTLDKILEDQFLQIRPCAEFTDKIWDILKESESLSELSDGMREVFMKISAGDIRPRIHVRNDTDFAVLCRELVREPKLSLPCEDWFPVKMLIQMGCEKIKEDYVNVFQVCDLATSEQLAPYITWRAKTLPFDECLDKLRKLHIILQVVVLLRSALNLPNSTLSHFTSKMFADLASKVELPRDFEFQVDTSSVKAILDNLVPGIWSYEAWTEEGNVAACDPWVKFVVRRGEGFFQTESVNEHGLTSILTESETPRSEDQTFYCLSLSSVGDIFSSAIDGPLKMVSDVVL